MRVDVYRTHDEIYFGLDEDGREIGAFVNDGDGWWSGCLTGGTERRLWVPKGDPLEAARRMFGGP
ncbi:hypothetical protein [Actinomadura sp. 6N118]|uniref:hypothetical protein n=1 Tax=Actinomadura sp. 6N118 TaxID=3375151 RepID=UPI0037BDC8C1